MRSRVEGRRAWLSAGGPAVRRPLSRAVAATCRCRCLSPGRASLPALRTADVRISRTSCDRAQFQTCAEPVGQQACNRNAFHPSPCGRPAEERRGIAINCLSSDQTAPQPTGEPATGSERCTNLCARLRFRDPMVACRDAHGGVQGSFQTTPPAPCEATVSTSLKRSEYTVASTWSPGNRAFRLVSPCARPGFDATASVVQEVRT